MFHDYYKKRRKHTNTDMYIYIDIWDGNIWLEKIWWIVSHWNTLCFIIFIYLSLIWPMFLAKFLCTWDEQCTFYIRRSVRGVIDRVSIPSFNFKTFHFNDKAFILVAFRRVFSGKAGPTYSDFIHTAIISLALPLIVLEHWRNPFFFWNTCPMR